MKGGITVCQLVFRDFAIKSVLECGSHSPIKNRVTLKERILNYGHFKIVIEIPLVSLHC